MALDHKETSNVPRPHPLTHSMSCDAKWPNWQFVAAEILSLKRVHLCLLSQRTNVVSRIHIGPVKLIEWVKIALLYSTFLCQRIFQTDLLTRAK